ncbi:MAG: hypothetical protein R2828_00455 [Saprospiraceae bacterium]
MNQDELIWQYLDGVCNEEEKAKVEQLIAADPAFLKAFEERKQLTLAFQSLELEHPSMRFTTNVMENLPLLYQRLPVKQLLGPNWIKAFWAGLSLLILSSFGLGIFSPNTTLPSSEYSDELTEVLTKIPAMLFVPYKTSLILLALSASYLLLMALDRKLGKGGGVNWNRESPKKG